MPAFLGSAHQRGLSGASNSSLPTSNNGATEADEWDEDAWADNSDDEKFGSSASAVGPIAATTGSVVRNGLASVGIGASSGKSASPLSSEGSPNLHKGRQSSYGYGYGETIWGYAFGTGKGKDKEHERDKSRESPGAGGGNVGRSNSVPGSPSKPPSKSPATAASSSSRPSSSAGPKSPTRSNTHPSVDRDSRLTPHNVPKSDPVIDDDIAKSATTFPPNSTLPLTKASIPDSLPRASIPSELQSRPSTSLPGGKKEQFDIQLPEDMSASVDSDGNVVAVTVRKRDSVIAREEAKSTIRAEVDDLVRDPVFALEMLRLSESEPESSDALSQPDRSMSSDMYHHATSSFVSPTTQSTSHFQDPSDEENVRDGYELFEAEEEKPETEEETKRKKEKRRKEKFVKCLGSDDVDIAELRKLAWAGIPDELRPIAWQLLLGYLPAPSSRRVSVLARKRQEYADAVRLAFAKGKQGLDQAIWHQIHIDVPRTNPGIRLWQFEGTQRSLERILYVWAIRHPASGYVQGINDLVTPFFQVFLSSYIKTDPEVFDPSFLPSHVLEALEADSFWCLSKLLDGIQDNYIFAQPGIQRQVARLKELCGRVDAPLAAHLEEQNVEFIQFAFRWMNCLLMREMSVKNIIRMWDTYLAEGTDAFSEFHLYVCLAFLVKWSEKLRSTDFQGIIMFLQSLPTQTWTESNTELLLSEAFLWKSTFAGAQSHFIRK